MRSFRLISVAFTAALLSACSGARIEGVLKGAPETDLVIKALDVNKYTVLDTVKTSKNSEYSYRLDIEKGHPEFVYIFYKNKKVASMLLMKGDKVEVVSDTLGNYSVAGSSETEKLISVERDEADFLNKMASAQARLEDLKPGSKEAGDVQKDAAKTYIEYYRSRVRYVMENSFSMTVVPVLYQTVGNLPVFNQVTDAIHFRSAADSLKSLYPDSKYVKALSEEADRRLGILELKAKIESAEELSFPDLEMPDVYGKKVKLSEVDSKMIMVYFWMASAAEQKMFNLDVIKPLYETYSKRGLEIFAVSLDTDKAAWANVVKNQNLPWINVCDGLGTLSRAAKVYNIPKVPMVYFIKEGRLLADVGVRDEASLSLYLEKNLK